VNLTHRNIPVYYFEAEHYEIWYNRYLNAQIAYHWQSLKNVKKNIKILMLKF